MEMTSGEEDEDNNDVDDDEGDSDDYDDKDTRKAKAIEKCDHFHFLLFVSNLSSQYSIKIFSVSIKNFSVSIKKIQYSIKTFSIKSKANSCSCSFLPLPAASSNAKPLLPTILRGDKNMNNENSISGSEDGDKNDVSQRIWS